MNYRLIAVAKTKTGTLQYAVIETESQSVVAIAYANTYFVYALKMLEESPTAQKWIVDFIKEEERNHRI